MPKEISFILLNLRNLHNFSVDEISIKLNISREEYRSLEKGTIKPSKDLSKKLYQLFLRMFSGIFMEAVVF